MSIAEDRRMCKYFCLQNSNRTRKFVDVLKTHKIVWNDFFFIFDNYLV